MKNYPGMPFSFSAVSQQIPEDALRSSWTTPSEQPPAGVGGAWDPGRRDLGSIGEPAGLGMYKTSEFVLSRDSVPSDKSITAHGHPAARIFNLAPAVLCSAIPAGTGTQTLPYRNRMAISMPISITKDNNYSPCRAYAESSPARTSASTTRWEPRFSYGARMALYT